MRSFLFRAVVSSAAMAVVPAAALAHTGHGDVHGLMRGLMHPFGGLDHLLAMIGVGALAALIGGAARWTVPASFVAVMGVGAALGYYGVAVPGVEAGIALSVVALGVLLAARLGLSAALAMAVVAVFGLFHGHAHGAEAPAGSSGAIYALGFVVSTVALHAAGLAGVVLAGRLGSAMAGRVVRIGGAVMALAGVGLIAGQL